MYNNTEHYRELIAAWQQATDRREAHQHYCNMQRGSDPISYKRFMGQIRYITNEKGIKLKHLDLPQTDWDSLKQFAQVRVLLGVPPLGRISAVL